MATELTVLQIVESHLRANGYDGLVSDDRECACLVSDLAPCSEMMETCVAGYRVPCDCGDHDYHVGPQPPAPAGEGGE